MDNRYQQYLKTVGGVFQKVVRLDFLNPDNSVAFSLGGLDKRSNYTKRYGTSAFVQSGSLSVSLNNGQRRKATITLSNLDGSFDYNVNNIWFGRQVRLLMGVVLPDNTEFYLPQGVFYIKDPQTTFKPNEKSVTFPLYDKWAYLDGTLAGKISEAYQITIEDKPNVFEAMRKVLTLSKYDHLPNDNKSKMIDPIEPVFTTYYNDKFYYKRLSDGSISEEQIPVTELPYDIMENAGGNYGNLLLQLNDTYVGLIGYDQTGALRVEPSQDDISDKEKPVLWNFTPYNSQLVGLSETIKNSEVYNQIVIAGEGLSGGEVWGSASNYDPSSDTNINLIGIKPYYERKAEYWNSKQCADLASWMLKRKTVLQKSINVECSQMFHLFENGLITIQRTDKKGKPIERHLINSYTIPIGETGSMTINATSVNDFVGATIEKYPEHILPMEYQQVEYIESTGTQFIDTNFAPNQDTRLIVDTQLLKIGRLAGSGYSSNVRAFYFSYGSVDSTIQPCYGSSAYFTKVAYSSNRQLYDLNKNRFYLDNTIIGTAQYENFTSPFSIYLFGAIINSGVAFSNQKLYSCEIYDNNKKVREFIPCYRIADGAIGLYDIVGNAFYENQGTGSFLKGENIG